MTRLNDTRTLNIPGQQFRAYVGLGNEVRFITNGFLASPPPTIYVENRGLHPNRVTVNLGPNRIAFCNEGLPVSAAASYQRRRVAAQQFQWTGTGNPTIQVAQNTNQETHWGYQQSYALYTWSTPGIYEIDCTVGLVPSGQPNNGTTPAQHTGKRQVIVYPSREQAWAGVVEISGIQGSTEQGGWSCSIRVKDNLDFLLKAYDLDGYIPVVIYADQYFEEAYGVWARRELGANWRDGKYEDDPRIIFSGYLDRSSIMQTHDDGSVTFQCRTSDLVLENMQSHTVGFFESAHDGSGMIFNDLMTADVIMFMLKEFSNFADWHDTRMFYNQYAGPTATGGSPGIEYNDWTWNQGMYWSNVRDTAANEFHLAYVDQRSALHVVPDRNMWRADVFFQHPLSKVVPVVPENEPIGIVALAPSLTEPVCVPLEIRVNERLATGVSYYKIIASLSFWNEEWGADYPHGQPRAASGKWVLDQGRYYSNQDRQLAWDTLWNFAARGYAANNSRYGIEVVFGMHTYWRLGDLVEVIYTDPQNRVAFVRASSGDPPRNYFEVVGINYETDLETGRWRTTYQLREITTYIAPTPTIPALPQEVDR